MSSLRAIIAAVRAWPVRRLRRILLVGCLASLTLLGVHYATRSLNGHSVFLSRTRATQKLERALTGLRALHVTGYRDFPWCKLLTVDGITYQDSTHESTCCWAPDGCRPYDSAARSKHAQANALLSATGVRVGHFTAEESPAHGLATAEFGLLACLFCRESYEYWAPGQGEPQGYRNEVRYRRIRPGWYYRVDDWN